MDRPERKRRGPLRWLADRTWRFWVGVPLLVLVLHPFVYVGSFALALWLSDRGLLPAWSHAFLNDFFQPLHLLFAE
jgi:hypothetical protein